MLYLRICEEIATQNPKVTAYFLAEHDKLDTLPTCLRQNNC